MTATTASSASSTTTAMNSSYGCPGDSLNSTTLSWGYELWVCILFHSYCFYMEIYSLSKCTCPQYTTTTITTRAAAAATAQFCLFTLKCFYSLCDSLSMCVSVFVCLLFLLIQLCVETKVILTVSREIIHLLYLFMYI